jgi:hypothetical protein
VSDLLEVRIVGAPESAERAVTRLGGLLDLDRQAGPYPSRKADGLVLFYLTGRLRPAVEPLAAKQPEGGGAS